ncbi:hypothetical protein [Streptomyces sp. KR80]|uniref:hypothetical protein n=1 Tax=Streptomyces sp. KR80 TaxID=3457426 RepID=UPI003FD69046
MTASLNEDVRHGLIWAGVAGILSAGLLAAGQALVWRAPDDDEPGVLLDFARFYRDGGNQDLAQWSVSMTLLGGFLFVWFLVALLRVVRAAEAGTGRMGSLTLAMLIGGTLFLVFALMAAIAGNIFAITAQIWDAFPVDDPRTSIVAMVLLDVSYAASVAAMAGAAVLLFALWRLMERTHAVPRWLGWFAFLVAVLSLGGPFTAWGTVMLFALWVLVTSVVLIFRAAAPAAPVPAKEAEAPPPGGGERPPGGEERPPGGEERPTAGES